MTVPLISGQAVPSKDESGQGTDALTFSDQPNFVVSGVTDWTAVGGHGSDATLRTSEDLARATASLTKSAAGSGDSKAEKTLRATAADHPQSDSANLAVGEYYLQQGRYQQALPFLQTASMLTHHNANVEYDLALTCRGMKDLPQARLHLEQALSKADKAEYHQLAGLLAEDASDPYTAVQQLRLATQIDPSEGNYFAWASELLLHRAVLQAVEVFRRGVGAFSDSARMKTGLGSALFAGGRYSESAEQLCDASTLLQADTQAYLLLGKVDEAAPAPCIIDRLTYYLQLQPGSATAQYLYAMALLRRGGASSLARSRAFLTQAIALDPSYAAAYLQLGILTSQLGQYPQAVELYKKTIALDEALPEAHFRLSVAYGRMHLPAEAKHEREIHAVLKQRQAEATEQQRRSVKQFTILQGAN